MWYMVPEIWTTTDFFVIMCHFLPFYPLNSPQNKNIKKMKKIPGDIIILHKYPKNHDHMLYCSRHTARDTCNCYFSFWALFCPFTPITDRKTKISGKIKKNNWKYHHFTHVYKNHDHMLYCSWNMARDTCSYFSFWAIFCPFTHLTTQKIKISKIWKNHPEVSSFYKCVPKIMIRWCTVPEIWCTTDGQKKWHIEVGAPPKKNANSLLWEYEKRDRIY